MKQLYLVNPEIKESKTYVYTTDEEAVVFSRWCNFVDGFILRYKSMEVFFVIDGKPVISLKEAADMGVNVIIIGHDWHPLYLEVCQYVEKNKIFIHSKSWKINNHECVMCGGEEVWYGSAKFHSFLQERMFLDETPDTSMVFCPNCGTYYSSYRPSDEELERLYNGYRDKEYQEMRQKHEPGYTVAFNQALTGWPDGYQERRRAVIEFIKDAVNVSACKNVLDFGGDKGQFIPEEFRNHDCYVYDISGVAVLEDVKSITASEELANHNWDLILCMHVLEHVSDVHGIIEKIKSYMSNKTCLYIELPLERVSNMDMVEIHEHINMFTEKIFFLLADKHDFKILKCSTDVNMRCLLKKRTKE